MKVPVGPIHSIPQALRSEQAEARGAVVRVPVSSAASETLELLGNPLKFSKTPVTYEKAPPRFGEDTQAVPEILAKHTADGSSRKG